MTEPYRVELTEVKTYSVKLRCDCSGEYKACANGPSHDGLWQHHCANCDRVQWLPVKYPALQYRAAGEHALIHSPLG